MKIDGNYAEHSPGERNKKYNQSSGNNSDSKPPKFCINCGSSLDEGDRFCTECGTKVEAEIIKSDKKPEEKSTSAAVNVSSDRVASIAETRSRILGTLSNAFQKSKFTDNHSLSVQPYLTLQKEEKKKLPSGIYVHKLSFQTMYLEIKSVIGKSIRVSVRTEFANGTYGIENYNGTLCENGISLHLSDYDLHTQYSFKLGESFLGIVTDNTISGKFSGEFSGYCIFKKIE